MNKTAFLDGYIQKQAITVDERRPWYKRPVSATVGRVSDIPTAVVLGTTKALQSAKPEEQQDMAETIKELKSRYKDMPTALRVSGARPVDDAKRIWKSDRISKLSKALGLATLPLTYAQTELRRADHYNPFADSATVYRRMPELAKHELGHGEDYHTARYPGAYSMSRAFLPMMLWQEYLASKYGGEADIEKMVEKGELDEEDYKKLKRYQSIMSAGMGSYIGLGKGTAGPIVGALIGRATGGTAMPFVDPKKQKVLDAMVKQYKQKSKG